MTLRTAVSVFNLTAILDSPCVFYVFSWNELTSWESTFAVLVFVCPKNSSVKGLSPPARGPRAGPCLVWLLHYFGVQLVSPLDGSVCTGSLDGKIALCLQKCQLHALGDWKSVTRNGSKQRMNIKVSSLKRDRWSEHNDWVWDDGSKTEGKHRSKG